MLTFFCVLSVWYRELHRVAKRVSSQTTGYFYINDVRQSIPGSLVHRSFQDTDTQVL